MDDVYEACKQMCFNLLFPTTSPFQPQQSADEPYSPRSKVLLELVEGDWLSVYDSMKKETG